MNNNTEIKNKLIDTIQNMLENNSVLKKQIVANKESKSEQLKHDTFPSFAISSLSYLGGIILLLIGLLEPSMRNTTFIVAVLSIFPLGWSMRFANKNFHSTVQNTNVIDRKDYYNLFNAGNKEQKKIIDLLKRLDGEIKYKEINI